MTTPSPVLTPSDDWRRRANGLFPGGVNSPVRAYRAVGGDPPILVRGEGAHVWDADGRPYLDYVGAYGPLLLGHANRRVTAALRRAVLGGGVPSGLRIRPRCSWPNSSARRCRRSSASASSVRGRKR